MEDYRLDIIMGQGPSARTMRLDISPFTLVGATTKTGLLSHPLRDRFVGHLHFDFYHPKELSKIINTNAQRMKLKITEEAVKKISFCSRGTPRIANRILRRVRDFSLVEKKDTIDLNHVQSSLHLMEIDFLGLDRMDRKILSVIEEYYGGGPVGIETICSTLSEDRATIEDVFEPFLLKEGLLIRTPRGRQVSEKGRAHLQKVKSTSPK